MNTKFNLDQYNEAEILVNKLRKKTNYTERCKIIDNITDVVVLKLIILSLTEK